MTPDASEQKTWYCGTCEQRARQAEMYKERADSATAQNLRLIAENEELQAKLDRAAVLALDSSLQADKLADEIARQAREIAWLRAELNEAVWHLRNLLNDVQREQCRSAIPYCWYAHKVEWLAAYDVRRAKRDNNNNTAHGGGEGK